MFSLLKRYEEKTRSKKQKRPLVEPSACIELFRFERINGNFLSGSSDTFEFHDAVDDGIDRIIATTLRASPWMNLGPSLAIKNIASKNVLSITNFGA
jgi:hypothetical protein